MFYFCLGGLSLSDLFNKSTSYRTSVIISLWSLTKKWKYLSFFFEWNITWIDSCESIIFLFLLKSLFDFKDLFIFHIKWLIGSQCWTFSSISFIRSRKNEYVGLCWLACYLVQLAFYTIQLKAQPIKWCLCFTDWIFHPQ